MPTVYKQEVRPPSFYIFKPFIIEVKKNNERMINMKKNMKTALLDRITNNSDFYMQVNTATDKQQFI